MTNSDARMTPASRPTQHSQTLAGQPTPTARAQQLPSSDSPLDIIAQEARSVAARFGLGLGPVADDMARALIERVALRLGGERVYIGKRKTLSSAYRTNSVRQEFTGNNQRELASRYGVSLRQVQRIIKSDKPK